MLGCKSSLRWKLQDISKDDRHVTHAALKTVAAFFNTEGGDILIGVDDDRKALGSPISWGHDDEKCYILTSHQNSRIMVPQCGRAKYR